MTSPTQEPRYYLTSPLPLPHKENQMTASYDVLFGHGASGTRHIATGYTLADVLRHVGNVRAAQSHKASYAETATPDGFRITTARNVWAWKAV